MAEKAFAFRMSPELKEAAKVLTKARFSEWWEKDGQEVSKFVWLSSINEALLYLVKVGSKHTIAALDREISTAKADCEFWQDLAKFFIDHPERDIASAGDFSPDSETRAMIYELNQGVDGPMANTMSREEAFKGLSELQGLLKGRMDARSALLRAALSEVVA